MNQGSNDLKNELICVIMGMPPEKQNKLWEELVAAGIIKEDQNGN